MLRKNENKYFYKSSMTRYWTFINIREMYLTWVKTKTPALDNISKVETIYFDQ